jgi:hypothetical protein
MRQVVLEASRNSHALSAHAPCAAQKCPAAMRLPHARGLELLAKRRGKPWQHRRHVFLSEAGALDDPLRAHERRRGVLRPALVEQPNSLGLQDLDRPVRIVDGSLELGVHELPRQVPARCLRPCSEADRHRLAIPDLEPRAMDALRGLDGFRHPAEPVETERDVPARGIRLPAVAGPVEDPDRLTTLLDRFLEARSRVKTDPPEMQ